MDYHQEQLGSACRICGLKLKKSKKYCPVYDCSEYFTQLHRTFNTDVLHDSPLVHPPSFCSLCYGTVRRTTAALDSGSTYTPASTPHFHWEPHSEQGCRVSYAGGEKIIIITPPIFWFLCFKVCEHFHTLSRGGRPVSKDKLKTGRPKGITIGSLLQMVRDIAPPSNFSSDIRPEVGQNKNLTCPVCLLLLDRPLDTLCGSTVCAECICKWICSCDTPSCPCCYDGFDHTHITKTSNILNNVLNSSIVKCPQGCEIQVKYFTKHMTCNSEVCMGSRNPTLTVQDILQKPLAVPMTTTERNVAGYLIKKMMASSPDDTLLSVPTRGQVNFKILKEYGI